MDYEKQTDINLVTHPLAEQLRNCHSAEDVTTLLQGHAPALESFQGSDGIKSIASGLSMLSTTIVLGDSIGLVRQKAFMAVFCSSYTFSTAVPTCGSNAHRYPCPARRTFHYLVAMCVLS
jgi:tetrahydromethanopterin S-methyltransferase subunit B